MPQPSHISRRRVLGATGVAGLLVSASAAGLISAPQAAAAAADGTEAGVSADAFDTLLQRAEELVTGGSFNAADPDFAAAVDRLDTTAAELWSTMDRSAGRTFLWPDMAPVTNPDMFGQSYPRLATLAAAWKVPGTSLSGREDVAQAVVAGLRFLHDRAFNPTATRTGNWWFWEIGAPRGLLDTCVLMRAKLPAADLSAYLATVAKWCPNPDRRVSYVAVETGANRSDKSVIVALHGLLARDAAKVAQGRDGLSDVAGSGANSLFTYVTSGDGFYADGSFIQHNYVAYTGAYGQVMLSGLAYILALLAGSAWAVTDPDVAVIHDAVERSFSPFVFEGLMMDSQSGRSVSRWKTPDSDKGARIVSGVLLLAQSAPAAYASRWRALAKGWIQRNKLTPYLAGASIPQVARARAVLDNTAIVPTAPLTGAFAYAGMDRMVHRRPTWALSLGMSSARVSAYECGNFENKHGWYQGDGVTYLYTAGDLGQFGDSFWATVDPYRLPGTTVDTRTRAKIGDAAGTKTFQPANATAGGAALGKRFGAAAMDLAADGCTLRAKKVWFTLDNAVIALGAGITSTDGRAIETIVENRNLHTAGTNRLTVDGSAQPTTQGWTKTFTASRWAHLEGTGGYVFPNSVAVRALRAERTGTWAAINTGADTGGTDDPVTRRYLTLWLDHGSSPSNASYAYALLPGATAAATADWAASQPVRIVANTAVVQAVEARADGLLAAHFWAAGNADGLTCSAPATVLVRKHAGGVSVAVADTSRTQETVRIELPYAATRVVSADATVTVTPGGRAVVTVRTGGSRGRTHVAELA
ncbi:polysaccharide lyase 8 family protein [Streptomyces sp. YC504]|uniref:Polysaccharide lyase 8 family protein n=1 Tax=Streptomyces mesophilus TaxID=1775132 RepID=A0A6G4XSP2_9ACTN|nr:polysaccharide lyase 8 family protein [Streptomyces mesophilus]NGO80585.1 polysaccharide lyase 8 family protein [Streptomyces mesophilus]